MLLNGLAVKEIQQGTFTPPESIDPFAADFLVKLQHNPVPPEHRTHSDHITVEDNATSWKKKKVGTASEPSQLSFAHQPSALECQKSMQPCEDHPMKLVSPQSVGRLSPTFNS